MPALQSLLEDARALMEECGHLPNLVFVAPGNTVAWDNCCEGEQGGGQMWTRLVSIVPLPQTSQPCDISNLQVRAALGTVRCMAGIKDDGSFPTAAEMTSDALVTGQDQDIMLRAIRDWQGPQSPRTVNLKSLRVEQGVPLGPTGYCGGFEWTLAFQVALRAGC